MLTARGDRRIGGAQLRWTIAFTQRLWCLGVEREGLVLDTRFIPATQEAERDRVCLYLLVRGSFEIHGPAAHRFDAPCAFVLSETQIDGARGVRPLTYRAGGRPFAAIEIHLRPTDLTSGAGATPTALALDARSWEHARAIVSAQDVAQVPMLLGRLAELGIVTMDAAGAARETSPRAFVALWDALRPMIERLYLTPTLQEIGEATGVSLRQVDRYVQDFVTAFALVGDGWRPTTRFLRLKLAILLSSAEHASVGEVARIVGYGSPDAMARAFRDAGLAPPSVVQERVRASARERE